MTMPNLVRRNHDSRGIATNGTNPVWDAFRMMDALLGWDPAREGTRVSYQSTFARHAGNASIES